MGVSIVMGVPQKSLVSNGTSPSKMEDDWGYPLLQETSKYPHLIRGRSIVPRLKMGTPNDGNWTTMRVDSEVQDPICRQSQGILAGEWCLM